MMTLKKKVDDEVFTNTIYYKNISSGYKKYI